MWFWLKVTVVVVLLVGLLQLLRDAKFFERWTASAPGVARTLGLQGEALFPLGIGLVFGLTYGGAILMQIGKEKAVPKRDLSLVIAFLALCHAIFEDTALFAILGAKWWIMAGLRLALAVSMLAILARLLLRNPDPDATS